jgi:hypothetical protein
MAAAEYGKSVALCDNVGLHGFLPAPRQHRFLPRNVENTVIMQRGLLASSRRRQAAAFVGAPTVPFTVQGAAPTRDGGAVGFSVSAAVADAASVYVRYEAMIAGQDSSDALTPACA